MGSTPNVVTLMNDLEISAAEAQRLLNVAGGDADKAMYNYFHDIAPPPHKRKPKKPATRSAPKALPAVVSSTHVTTIANLLLAMNLTDAEIELFGTATQTPACGGKVGMTESFNSYLTRMGLKHRRRRGPLRPPAYKQYVDLDDEGTLKKDARARRDARIARAASRSVVSPDVSAQEIQDNSDLSKAGGSCQSEPSQSDISKKASELSALAKVPTQNLDTDKNVFRRLAAQDRESRRGKIPTLDGSADLETHGTTAGSNTSAPTSFLLERTQGTPRYEHLPEYIPIYINESPPTPIHDTKEQSLDVAPNSSASATNSYHLTQRRYDTSLPYDEVLKTFNTPGAAEKELKTLTKRHCRAKWVRNDEGKMVSRRPLYVAAEDGMGFAIKARGGAVEVRVWIAKTKGAGHPMGDKKSE
ncbi:hypothetical protein BKA63DRAFT_92782 [Paraphoma chrysanthemicola]|nr:hypothetical protein BKA63DRAFT_92782 [Paraphoma chrysanthemicola]